MNLFNVYPLYAITPVKALGSAIWDENGVEYLDMYGGHAVISIGHSHPHYVAKLTNQLANIGSQDWLGYQFGLPNSQPDRAHG